MTETLMPLSRRYRLCRTLGRLLPVLLIAGCTVGPDFVRSTDALGSVVLSSRGDFSDGIQPSTGQVPSQWWMLFNDAVLGELQLRAQVSNLELQAALARIEQSRAELGITSALRFPRVGLGMDYAREAQSENGKFAALGASTSHGDFWQSGFDASWEIDLWGRVRRAREGAAATLEVALYDREAVRVALSSEVARAYLQLRGTQAQLEVARQNQIVADESPLVS